MTTTQPWEREWKLFYPQVREISLDQSIEATTAFITSTRLSAYKEGQRDMREDVVGLVKKMYNQEADKLSNESHYATKIIGDLISEITK
jgi:hypothetical protein